MLSSKGCKELFKTPVHCKMSPAELSHTMTYQTSCHRWKEKAPNIQQGIIECHSGTSAGPEENRSRRRSLCSSSCFPHATLIVLAAALWKHSRLWHTQALLKGTVHLGTTPSCSSSHALVHSLNVCSAPCSDLTLTKTSSGALGPKLNFPIFCKNGIQFAS